jgi:soluble lytic murein transglycosylase
MTCKKSLVMASLALALLLPASSGDAASSHVIKALEAMQKDQWKEARKLSVDSKDPVARKLYLWMFIKKDKGNVSFSTLAQFIKANPAWPNMESFRAKAEKSMPDDLGAVEVLSWFENNPPVTARGVDHYIEALLISGQRAKAKTVLDEWWAEKLVTREDQKNIYYKYGKLI